MSGHVLAEAQRRGGEIAFVDAEHALDPTYARALGVRVEDMLISQPDTGEQALEITESLVRSGAIDVVVVDSVAALVPRAEIEGEMGDSYVGLQARLMSQALRKLTGAIGKTNCIVVFINQLREKVGVVYGNPEVTTGGRALKFYASVRIDVRRIETLKNGSEIIGNRTRAKVVKNKVAPPFREAEFDIMKTAPFLIENRSVPAQSNHLPRQKFAGPLQGSLDGLLNSTAAGYLHPYDSNALDVISLNDFQQFIRVIHGIQLGTADQCHPAPHKAAVEIAGGICGAVRCDKQIGSVKIGRVHRNQLDLNRPLPQLRRCLRRSRRRRRGFDFPQYLRSTAGTAAEWDASGGFGGQMVLYRLRIVGSGLALREGDGAGGAGGQTVAQSVAVVIPQKTRFSVYHGAHSVL